MTPLPPEYERGPTRFPEGHRREIRGQTFGARLHLQQQRPGPELMGVSGGGFRLEGNEAVLVGGWGSWSWVAVGDRSG